MKSEAALTDTIELKENKEKIPSQDCSVSLPGTLPHWMQINSRNNYIRNLHSSILKVCNIIFYFTTNISSSHQ